MKNHMILKFLYADPQITGLKKNLGHNKKEAS